MNQNVGLYRYLPDQCKLDKDIPQRFFTKEGRIKNNRYNRFDLYFQKANLAYVLRKENGGLPNLAEGDPLGEEIHVLEVTVKTRSDGWYPLNSFAKAIIESYPRPMLLILTYKDEYCIFASLCHINSRKNSKNVADRVQGSGWITRKNCARFECPEDYFYGDYMFSPCRSIERDVSKIITGGKCIESIMIELHAIIGVDRGMWVYFYHASDEYYEAQSVIRSDGYYNEEPEEEVVVNDVSEDDTEILTGVMRLITWEGHESYMIPVYRQAVEIDGDIIVM